MPTLQYGELLTHIATTRAVALNEMDGFTFAYLGFLTEYAGDWERGGALSAKARSLNPHHPGWYWFVPCFDAYRRGDYKTSLAFARKVNMPGFWRTQLAIAATAGQLGDKAASDAEVNLGTRFVNRLKHLITWSESVAFCLPGGSAPIGEDDAGICPSHENPSLPCVRHKPRQ
jgi:hypothetical protein